MKFKIHRYDFSDTIEFSGSLTRDDVARINLDPHDATLLNQTDTGKASDALLVLEMLFRRFEEQTDTRRDPK